MDILSNLYYYIDNINERDVFLMEHYSNYEGIDMTKEVYVEAHGFPNYLVSNYGTVINRKTKHIKVQTKNKKGYLYVQLVLPNKPGSHKNVFVHRLVAYSFMKNPNPDVLDVINHKDENPNNNHLNNLEFCDREWNANWGTNLQRIKLTQIKKNLTVGVYAINKQTKRVYKFSSIKEASRFTGKADSQIHFYLNHKSSAIGGNYVFCYPQQYRKDFVQKLIEQSYHNIRLVDDTICVIDIKTKKVFEFNTLKQLEQSLHINYMNIYQLLDNPTLPNPYQYVFCKKSQYNDAYLQYLLAVYTPKEKQAITIVGMNINTEEIRHFNSIKQAEHELNNQSVQPYLSGKVKSAKDWVFCKEFEYTKKLLQQKAREANPNQNFEIVILNCRTGETITTLSSIKDLAIKYQVSANTIRNQLNHNAVSINGQQFIYKDNYDHDTKQLFMNLYEKRTRGKAVYAINIDTLETNKYDSVTQASKELNISQDRILAVLKRDSNQTDHYAFSYETYYSKFRMYLLAYIGKYGKDGFPVSSVDKSGKQKFYSSVKEASKVTGIRKNNIFRVIRGERKTAGGYSWFKENRDKYIQSLTK